MPLDAAIAQLKAEVAARTIRQVAQKKATGLGERGRAHEIERGFRLQTGMALRLKERAIRFFRASREKKG